MTLPTPNIIPAAAPAASTPSHQPSPMLTAEFTGSASSTPREWLKSLPGSVTYADRNFKALAYGAQAAVFADETHVLKIGLSVEQSLEVLERATRFLHVQHVQGDLTEAAKINVANWNRTIAETKAHLESGRLDPRILANTQIDENGIVLQTRVLPVERDFDIQSIGDVAPSRVQALVDRFALCLVRAFKSGACETECSLFTNYGFYLPGYQLTIIDFGNVTYSYEKAVKSVGTPPTLEEALAFVAGDDRTKINEEWPDWFKKGQVREALKDHPALFKHYVTTMSALVNSKSLANHWPTALK